MFRRLLGKIEHNRPFAEVNALVAYRCGSVAPAFPAPVGAANETRISARVDGLNRRVAALYGEVIIDQEIRGCGIADLLQTLRGQGLLNSCLYSVLDDLIFRTHLSCGRLTATRVIARNHPARIAGVNRFRKRLPGP